MKDNSADAQAAELERLKTDVSRLRGRVESLHTANGRLRDRITTLQETVRELRKRPAPVKASKAEIDETYGVEHVRLLLGRTKRPRLNEAVARNSEAQTGCPVTYTYTRSSLRRWVETSGFAVDELFADHIFPYRIPDYVQYRYTKAFPFN